MRRPTVHPVAGDGWPEQLDAENLGLSEKRRFGGETPFRARNVMVALGRTAVVQDVAPVGALSAEAVRRLGEKFHMAAQRGRP